MFICTYIHTHTRVRAQTQNTHKHNYVHSGAKHFSRSQTQIFPTYLYTHKHKQHKYKQAHTHTRTQTQTQTHTHTHTQTQSRTQWREQLLQVTDTDLPHIYTRSEPLQNLTATPTPCSTTTLQFDHTDERSSSRASSHNEVTSTPSSTPNIQFDHFDGRSSSCASSHNQQRLSLWTFLHRVRQSAVNKELTVVKSSIHTPLPGGVLTRKMSGKKMHEVPIMAGKIACLAAEHNVTCILDVGSGLGYLSHELAARYGLRYITHVCMHSVYKSMRFCV
jgi:hypothetical protein